jgi:serine/threonine protein kinase/tetratricopeptide (TPR) repeat protein
VVSRPEIPLLPGFEISRLIGQGGLGHVYAAVRLRADGTREPVALKRLALERGLPDRAMERFLREARIASRLDHPNIVRALELVTLGEERFLVMELLEGEDVGQLSRHGGMVPGWVAMEIAAQALAGLEYAHRACDADGLPLGLVHRDLTPGNVFVCHDGRIKLLDFGTAKLRYGIGTSASRIALTQEGRVHATPEFISPEQARGEEVDPRSDLFQLGATLYFLLSGQSPHGTGPKAALLARAAHGRAIPLDSLRTDLTGDVARIIGRVLEPERERRFASAAEMQTAVVATLNGRAERGPRALCGWLAARAAADEVATWVDRPASGASGGRVGGGYTTTDIGPAAAPRLPTPAFDRGSRVGRYLVLERIGEGAMAVVYAAYDPELDRRVALKLIRPRPQSGLPPEEARERLLREAQANARVVHRNVVTIYDVGTVGNQVFLAMELVPGGTLQGWMQRERPPWHKVLRAFCEAGRGLAAAHAAGLVHRDFKPENVLRGEDGRVYVSDFGLARRADPSAIAEAPTLDAADPDRFRGRLTQQGTVVGTPAYMAPEQHRGAVTTARSDQFSFCVALYEALFNERPYALGTLRAWDGQGAAPVPRVPPRGTGVPGWVFRVVRTGLLPRPEQRYPSMNALLAALDRDPVARRRTVTAAVAALLVLGGGVVGWQRLYARRVAICSGAEAEFKSFWNDSMRETCRKAFVATGHPRALAIWERTAERIDRYAAEWGTVAGASCEATRVRRLQSEATLDLRMRCLNHGLVEASTIIASFVRADLAVVNKAASAVSSLPPVLECEDTQSVERVEIVAGDATTGLEVDDVRRELDRVGAYRHLGKYALALPIAERAGERAQALRLPRLSALAHFNLALVYGKTGRYRESEELARRAILDAESSSDVGIAVQCYNWLTYLHGNANRYEQALEDSQHSQAWAQHLSGRERVHAETWRMAHLAVGENARGHHAEAARLTRQAFASCQASSRPELSWQCAMILNNAVYPNMMLGAYGEADAQLQLGERLIELALGPDSMELATFLLTRADLENARGHFDAALRAAERALELRTVNQQVGADIAECHKCIAHALAGRGDSVRAIEEIRKARAFIDAGSSYGSPQVADVLETMGWILLRAGRASEALTAYREALEVQRKPGGTNPGVEAIALTGMGEATLQLGDAPGAAQFLERALAAAEQVDPIHRGRACFALARARAQVGGATPVRMTELLDCARQAFKRVENRDELSRLEHYAASRVR